MKAHVVCACLLLCVLLLAVSLPLTLSDKDTSDTKPADEVAILTITDIPVSRVAGVSIRYGEDSLGLIPVGTAFDIIGHEEIPFDPSKLSALVYSACHLQADRRIDPADDLSVYGLDQPQAKIALLLQDGDPIRLFFGDRCPISDQIYMCRENDPAVYLISAAVSALLIRSPEDLRTMELYPPTAELLGISISNTSGSYTLSRKQDSVSGLFEMVSPVSCDLSWTAVDEKILSPLRELVPDHFIASGAQLSDYAGELSYVLSLYASEGTWTCRFATAEDGTVYCSVNDEDIVYSIAPEKTSFLETAYSDLLGSSLYRRSVSDVAGITLTADANQYTIDFSGTADTLTSVFSHRVFGAVETQKIYNLLTSIPIAGELTEEANPGAVPLITMTVRLRDGDTDILEFLPMGTSYCAVALNGEAQFATYASVPSQIVQVFLSAAQAK